MTREHYRPEKDDTSTAAPFKVRGANAVVSWVALCAIIGTAFTAGVWATNLQAKLETFQTQIYELKESQHSMQADIAWLVREQGGQPHGKAVAAIP